MVRVEKGFNRTEWVGTRWKGTEGEERDGTGWNWTSGMKQGRSGRSIMWRNGFNSVELSRTGWNRAERGRTGWNWPECCRIGPNKGKLLAKHCQTGQMENSDEVVQSQICFYNLNKNQRGSRKNRIKSKKYRFKGHRRLMFWKHCTISRQPRKIWLRLAKTNI